MAVDQFLNREGTQSLIDAIRGKVDAGRLGNFPNAIDVDIHNSLSFICDDNTEVSFGYCVRGLGSTEGYYVITSGSGAVGDFGETDGPSI